MKKASVFQRTLPLLAFFLICLLTACSSNQPSNLLVGTWLSDYNEIVVFEKDGSCSAPFTYNSSWLESADRYTVTDDGTLVLSSEAGHAGGSYERVETEEEALNDRYTYFVSKDTLIIKREIYTKSK